METPEQTSPRPNGSQSNSQSNSWGAIISILLILIIVVAGAYYAFTDRVGTPATQVQTGY